MSNYPVTSTTPLTGDIVLSNNGNALFDHPESSRVATTEKVFNVLDFGRCRSAFRLKLSYSGDNGSIAVYVPNCR